MFFTNAQQSYKRNILLPLSYIQRKFTENFGIAFASGYLNLVDVRWYKRGFSAFVNSCPSLLQNKTGAVNLHRFQSLLRSDRAITFPLSQAKAEAWGLAKIILPAEVCKALVTTTRTSPPT